SARQETPRTADRRSPGAETWAFCEISPVIKADATENDQSSATGSRSSVTRSSACFGTGNRSRKYRPSRVRSLGCSALINTCQRQRFLIRSTGHGAGPTTVSPCIGRLRSSAWSHVVAEVASCAVAASVAPLNTTLARRTFGGYAGDP